MIELSFRQEEAKLIYLAIAYHLGRPGSELDPTTKLPVEHGLAEVGQALQPQLQAGNATFQLTDDNQVTRLQSAMHGTISELKAYPMLELRLMDDGTGRRSTVPGFDATLRHFFPDVEEEPEVALDLAGEMLTLRRRLDERLAELGSLAPPPEPEKQKRGWWPFGR
jgi:hypothetical protein